MSRMNSTNTAAAAQSRTYRLPLILLLAALTTAVWIARGYNHPVTLAAGVLLCLLIFLGFRALGTRLQGRKKAGAAMQGIAGLSGLFVSSLFPLLLPVFELPKPGGPYAVGTMERVIDTGREESATTDPSDKRRLVVRLWYPAEAAEGAAFEPYPQEMKQVLSLNTGVPAWLAGHWDAVRTHAVSGAPLASQQKSYPILVYSHGAGASRYQSLFHLEELASRGYIVAAPDHSYMAAETRFPDGSIARDPGNQALLSAGESAELIGIRAADVSSVLDELTRWNQTDSGFWKDRLDLGRAGVLGHSDGGSTALEALAADSRFKAGLNMDGTAYGRVVESGVSRPVMFLMASQTWQGMQAEAAKTGQTGPLSEYYRRYVRHVEQVYTGSRSDAYRVTLPDTHHFSFSDAVLFSPVLAGGRPAKEAHAEINRYTLAFFDRYLLQIPSPLLEQGGPHGTGVRFEKRAAE
ncbi:carboxylic ester hydrolase [Paenibacillus mucilaginosus K02]|uniref:Carboxylic ester hydrolase n=2 Tax=Paenibacillus mucilaginosus TaxID=61624 RepID=I0BMF2_9BACL|nr:carboxylic ester hydrolase [Paenibacillus mucilaginosus K02]